MSLENLHLTRSDHNLGYETGRDKLINYGTSRTPLLFKEKKKVTQTISIDHQTS